MKPFVPLRKASNTTPLLSVAKSKTDCYINRAAVVQLNISKNDCLLFFFDGERCFFRIAEDDDNRDAVIPINPNTVFLINSAPLCRALLQFAGAEGGPLKMEIKVNASNFDGKSLHELIPIS